jgi:hypothetical protein
VRAGGEDQRQDGLAYPVVRWTGIEVGEERRRTRGGPPWWYSLAKEIPVWAARTKVLGDRWHGRQATQSRWGARGCGRGAVQGRRHPVDTEGEGGRWLGGALVVQRQRARCYGR